MRPVAPPTKKIGRNPSKLSRPIMMIDTKFPAFLEAYPNAKSHWSDRTRNTLISLDFYS